MSAISSAKDEMISPDEMEVNAGGDLQCQKNCRVYTESIRRHLKQIMRWILTI